MKKATLPAEPTKEVFINLFRKLKFMLIDLPRRLDSELIEPSAIMDFIKKFILTGLAAFYCFVPGVFAASSVLPGVDEEVYGTCSPETEVSLGSQTLTWKALFEGDPDTIKEIIDTSEKSDIEVILGCSLKLGEIQFWMVPYFVIFALEFVIELAGLIVVLMIMVGAYYYIAGGLTDDKEKGKTIITYALGGFVLILSSWILVNILLLALTS